MKKLWAGRFQSETSNLMDDFNSSISFDWKLYHYDIEGSKAHVRMLANTGIINFDQADIIINGLEKIEEDINKGLVDFSPEMEDIHMNIEFLLTKKIGPLGKKLHTARSRNDQVALDLKLYSRDCVDKLISLLINWINVLINIAEKNIDTLLPGYTHLQRAQPISLAHYLMAHVEMAKRDILRLKSWKSIHNTMPLGSGALAGTTFPIDRYMLCDFLNFDYPTMNSLDGVSDRDFVIDLLSSCSLGMMHLSRLCEDLIIWSSQEFSFIEMDDAYSTGSSMMPQKKNPDACELIRGKSARVYSDLFSVLSMMKALPLAYNKDMQEDKEPLFDGVETWMKSLKIITSVINTLKINKKKMFDATKGGFLNATDLADYLVKKGIAFRDSHKIVGQIVFDCIKKGLSLEDLSLQEYKNYCELIEDDVFDAINIFSCIENRKSMGAPNYKKVKEHINFIKNNFLNSISDDIS